jgi:uncharacterized phiE125 gp8 family phage protein
MTAAELKTFAHVDSAAEDTLIAEIIEAARCDAEKFTRRSFIETVWKLYLDVFPADDSAIELPRSPVSVVSSIKYVDTAGVTQTLSPAVYQTDIVREPARIALVAGQAWPETKEGQLNAVVIEFKAGYGALPSAVPSKLKLAVKFLAEHYFDNRLPKDGDSIPGHVRAMLRRYRVK